MWNGPDALACCTTAPPVMVHFSPQYEQLWSHIIQRLWVFVVGVVVVVMVYFWLSDSTAYQWRGPVSHLLCTFNICSVQALFTQVLQVSDLSPWNKSTFKKDRPLCTSYIISSDISVLVQYLEMHICCMSLQQCIIVVVQNIKPGQFNTFAHPTFFFFHLNKKFKIK